MWLEKMLKSFSHKELKEYILSHIDLNDTNDTNDTNDSNDSNDSNGLNHSKDPNK